MPHWGKMGPRGDGGFTLAARTHLGGGGFPYPISSPRPHVFWVPTDPPAPAGAGAAAILDGGRRLPRKDPFILHHTSEVFPCAVKSSPEKELSEGRINLLNNKNPAHLLMKCNDFETGKMDRAVAPRRSP